MGDQKLINCPRFFMLFKTVGRAKMKSSDIRFPIEFNYYCIGQVIGGQNQN